MSRFSDALGTSICIAKRDFKGFFSAPSGWIAAFVLFSVAGFAFYVITAGMMESGGATNAAGQLFSQLFGFLAWLAIFVIPVFPMRAMTEELDSGAIRIYSASPIPTWSIVLGKYLGIVTYFLCLVACLGIFPLYMAIFAEVEWPIVVSSLIGIWLHFAVLVSISFLVATATRNVVICYLFSAVGLFVIMIVSSIPGTPAWMQQSLNLLSLTGDLTQGKVKISTFVTFLSMISGFLFLSNLVLESKRWRF